MRSIHRKTRAAVTQTADRIDADSALSASCDPAAVLSAWFERAKAEDSPAHATAMTLGTCTPQGCPSSRIVTCKALVDEPISLLFYTQYATRKAAELAENPFASALFYWPSSGRQVRIEGRVNRLDDAQNRAFSSRLSFYERQGLNLIRLGRGVTDLHRGSSTTDDDRKMGDARAHSAGWGGYLVVANSIELWVSRGGRSHTSGRWIRDREAGWTLEKFSP